MNNQDVLIEKIMKAMRIQIHKTQALLAAGVVALTATSALGLQTDMASESNRLGEMLPSPTNEVPAQRLAKDFESFAPAVEKVAPAVVRIVTALSPGSPTDLAGAVPDPLQRYSSGRALAGRPYRPMQYGLGSGIIVTEDGYILTNGHLLAGANEVKVTLQDGREFKAKAVGLDSVTDIAVVKIDAHDLPTIPLADSRNVRVGDAVLAVGHPFGVGQTVTHGIVSATDRGGVGIEDYESFIQTDAPINPGNSGGALVDVHGELIGINTAIVSSTGGSLGIGFAIPSDLARKVMADLVKYGYVLRGYLGIEAQNLTPELAKEFNLDGVNGALVSGVVPNGPAERAGLKVGDVITGFDGKQVRDARHLRISVAEAGACHIVGVEAVRNGSTRPLRVILGQASDKEVAPAAEWPLAEQQPGVLQSVVLIELSSQVRQLLRIPHDVQGAVVLDLHAYSAAAQAGVRPGDVIESINRQELTRAEDVSGLSQKAGQKRALLRVWSHGASRFILVEG